MNNRTCTMPDCNRELRARGLCGSHYNQAHQPNRHAKKMVACVRCGKQAERSGGGGRKNGSVCSLACRTALNNEATGAHVGKDLVGPVQARRAKPYATWDAELPSTRLTFTSGPCAWCGEAFTSMAYGKRNAQRCCTITCERRRARHLSPASKGSTWITQRRRVSIYERDNWTCQLCGDPVDSALHHSDNWSASLDHIVPRSRQLVPDHSDSNLRLAHRWCNSVLSDGRYYTELDLAA